MWLFIEEIKGPIAQFLISLYGTVILAQELVS